MTPRHLNSPSCPRCLELLKQACLPLQSFANAFRAHNMDAHVSCAYRGSQAQEEAFQTGHSKAHFGESAHNTLPSSALDWFRLTQPNQASFDRIWFQDVLAPAARAYGLVYGGDWTVLKDWPHVEVKGWKKP